MKKEKKARSKSQQRLFGMVSAYKSGKLKLDDLPPSLAKKVKGIADGKKRKTGDKRRNTKGVTKKAAKEMASTKHKEIPEKIKEGKTLRFEDYTNESKGDDNYMDALTGGEAEDMTIEDIAKKHDVPVEYLEKIMSDAIEIEMEHTDDPEVAARIALDHLEETPLYYDEVIGLPNMEEELDELEDEDVKDTIQRVLKYGEREKTYQEMDKDLEKVEDEEEQEKEEVEEILDDEIEKKVKKFNEL